MKRSHTDRDAVLIKVMMTMMTRQKTKSSSRRPLIVLLALCLSFVLIQSTNVYGGFTQVAAQEDVGDGDVGEEGNNNEEGEEEDGEIDTKSTVEDENLNDPGSFGELPAYKENDSFRRRTGSRWTGAGAAMLWDVGDTFGKAWDAGYKKISSHAAPRLSAAHDWSHKYIHENIRDFVPKEYSPFIAAVITYSLPLLPVCVVIFILNRLKAMLSLQKVLLVVNAYNATYCFILWFINALTGNEPMASLQASNEADYIILQFLKCVSYAVYLFLQLFHIAILYGTKAETMKTVAIGNFFLSVCIGFHYFIKVWSPAMHGHPPATSQITYILYTMMFGTMAYSSYLRDPQERAQAASVSTMFGVDKQF